MHAISSNGSNAFRQKIDKEFLELDDFLTHELEFFEEPLRPFLKHFFEGHGKRLRASLLFATGYDASHRFTESLAKAAAILEMVHYATLVHDDILDQSLLRQSHPTLWKETNSKIAVLLGDALFARALVLASEFPTPRVCQIVANATQQVCSGEILQTLLLKPYHQDFVSYERVITLKTAALFEAATELGALLSEQEEGFIQASKFFGNRVGLAYQIFDDAVDYWAKETQAGKTLGTDYLSGKPTLPFFLLTQNLSKADADKLHKDWASQQLGFDKILEIFKKLDVKNKTQSHFLKLLDEAKAKIAPYELIEALPLMINILTYFNKLWHETLIVD